MRFFVSNRIVYSDSSLKLLRTSPKAIADFESYPSDFDFSKQEPAQQPDVTDETASDQDETKEAKKHINAQDKNLSTAGHYALTFELDDVLDALIQNGLNLALKDSDGNHIVVSDLPARSVTPTDIISVSLPDDGQVFQKRDSNGIEERLQRIFGMPKMTEDDTIGFVRSDSLRQIPV
mgnify:CR=1 FL=1